ncbi:hypothetical protein [Butyrivibrio fibrisolvens]|uniref:hypothetical protein n=1 Tax=Butyrivibrio fibrisolvens TaxID=831 RepID=UPI00040A29ED|nr:hypothetical protein [Butyrivibrio fibrisolvens]
MLFYRQIKEIDKYDVISFDIFDTLVTRSVGSPINVFYMLENMLEQQYGLSALGFAQKRIEAEKEARRLSNSAEITIYDIYEKLDVQDKKAIMQREVSLEISLAEVNYEMHELFCKCISLGKDVYLCSDMYLDKETIESILNANNYFGYKKILLSSECKVTKQNKGLYHELIKYAKVSPDRILHIGDNFRSDFINAKKCGIKSWWYRPSEKYLSPKSRFSNKSIFVGNMPKSFLKDKYWYQIGKYSLGNFLYGYCRWLVQKFESQQFSKIFFLSRDGWIMMKAFQEIAPDEMVKKAKYLYASRRSLIIPCLHLYDSFEDRIGIMFWKKRFTIKDFVESFGLDYSAFKERIYNNIGADANLVFERSSILESKCLRSVYEDLKENITDNSIKEFTLLIDYLRQEQFTGKVAIVDSGWFGNIQNALQKCVNAAGLCVDIHGYYIGIRSECKYYESQKMNGFLFFGPTVTTMQEKEAKINSIIETFHSCHEGSVKKFQKAVSGLEPVLKAPDLSDKQLMVLNEIQKGAMFRVKFLNKISDLKIITINPEDVFIGFERIGLYPSLFDAWRLGEFIEGKKVQGTIYYLLHPKKIKTDIHNANWKLGQLKRLCKVKINYAWLYDILDK